MIPSITAIQSTIRMRRARSQRPARVEPCSTVPCGWTGSTVLIASTVPSWNREPGPPEGPHRALGGGRGFAVLEEPVDGRPGPAHVGPEGPELKQSSRVRRAFEVIRRKGRELARAVRLGQRVGEAGAPVVVAFGAAALVEPRVDVGGRGLRLAVREEEHDPVVLREVERLELRAGPGSELRPAREEERNV